MFCCSTQIIFSAALYWSKTKMLQRCPIGSRSGYILVRVVAVFYLLKTLVWVSAAVCLGSLSCWKSPPLPSFLRVGVVLSSIILGVLTWIRSVVSICHLPYTFCSHVASCIYTHILIFTFHLSYLKCELFY